MFGKVSGAAVTLVGLFESIPQHDLEGDAPGMEKLRASISSMEIENEEEKKALIAAVDSLEAQGVACDHIDVLKGESGHANAEEILSIAQEGDYGTIVMGHHESGALAAFISGDPETQLLHKLAGRTLCIVA